jgi:hypothetical protein
MDIERCPRRNVRDVEIYGGRKMELLEDLRIKKASEDEVVYCWGRWGSQI